MNIVGRSLSVGFRPLPQTTPSTFRLHFGAVCGISPLQYIKQIRLQEARQMLWTQEINAGDVAHRVGYESTSQFTREYKRLFGEPPRRDAKRLQVGAVPLVL